LLDGPELSIGDVPHPCTGGELDAVSGGKLSLNFALDIHASESARIVCDVLAVAAQDCCQVLVAVHTGDLSVLAGALFMSLIHASELSGANPFDYLAELQKHPGELASNPSA
jgi:hypothetical protein